MPQDTTQPVGDSFLGMNSEASGDEVAASAQGAALISDFLTSPSFFDSCLGSQKLCSNCNDKGSWAKQRSEDRGREMRRILTEEQCLCPRDEHMRSALGT